MSGIRKAQVTHADPVAAARAFHERVAQPNMALVLFFCSSDYDLDALASELNRLFDGVPLAGCTTAGEIGPAGYCDGGISGVSFPATDFTAETTLLGPLQALEVGVTRNLALEARLALNTRQPPDSHGQSFAFLMIDGLSQREEAVIGALHNSLADMPLVGGSAGDDLRLERTFVFHEGHFLCDHGVLVLVHSVWPFQVCKTQHFVATNERLVITEADPSRRRVTEINGLPAAQEYARLAGVAVDDLSADRFALSPLVVLVNGQEYVRSIQKVNDDGSLTFYCAIEEGLVMRVARGVDLLDNLETELHQVSHQLGEPQLILACDCVLRKVALAPPQLQARAGQLARRHNIVGFNSYGEQVEGVHLNQTFTALAIASPESGGPA